MRKAIQQYLHRGFPLLRTDHQSWCYITGIGFLIALLINLQQPFGLNAWAHPYKWLVLSGFGVIYAMVTGFYYQIFQVIFPRVLSAATWTVGKEILISLIIFVSAGIVNWGYALATISSSTLSLTSFAKVQSQTFVFCFLPVLLLASLTETRYLRRGRPLTDIGSERVVQEPVPASVDRPIRLNGFSFKADELLYIASDQNYVFIHYTLNGRDERLHCRITLKKVESLLGKHSRFVRCHKSFIVNIEKVKKSHGNSENLTLVLIGCCEKIPVSRKYFQLIKDQLPLKKSSSTKI